MAATSIEGSKVDDQRLEEVALPSQKKREILETESVLQDDGSAGFGERKKSPSESREDEKGDAAGDPGNQTSTPEDAEASGGSTKESLDTNGPKLKEKGDSQEEKVQSESEKEMKTQTQEETQNQESLQEISPTQGLKLCLPHCRQILYYLSHQGASKSLFIYFTFTSLHVIISYP